MTSSILAFWASESKRVRLLWRGVRLKLIRYIFRTLSVGPLVAGLLIAALLWLPAQMTEIYLGVFDSEWRLLPLVRGAIALSCLVLLCSLLFYWHLMLSTPRISDIYDEYPDLQFDRNLLRMRNTKAAFCAALPLIGMLFGLVQAYFTVGNACANLLGSKDVLKWEVKLGPDCETIAAGVSWSTFKFLVVAVFVLATWVLLRRIRFRLMATSQQKSDNVRRGIAAIAAVMAVVALLGPTVVPEGLTVTTVWFAGPMVAVLVLLTSAVAILMGLSWFAHRFQLPVFTTLFLYAVFVAWTGIRANVATQVAMPAAAVATAETAGDTDHKTLLRQEFTKWLDKRQHNNEAHPVFIVAAEGGGIYAASAIGLFLSDLQDRNPAFAEHVFAISAVSGGSVGATLFHSLKDSKTAAPGADPKRIVGSNIERVLMADHLSPVVALVLPDLLGKFQPFPRKWTRATALERSLICAHDDVNLCRRDDGASTNRLTQPYEAHWSEAQGSALVLNTTWVETGFRVAFAPRDIKLQGVGDGTLYAFSDLPGVKRNVTLIEAAVASARFPLIAPPWIVRPEEGKQQVWNFVDGAYADNSGSTTALEIYRALKGVAESRHADLYLIILTDAVAAPDPKRINGSNFSDTMAPVTALLNVRGQLASRAVTQAIDYFKDLGQEEFAGRSPRSRLLIAKLEQRSVPLALGWKISRTEIDLVRMVLGSPDQCRDKVADPRPGIEETVATIIDNSCVKKGIVDLLPAQSRSPS